MPETKTRDDIVETIQKLLALATSTNEHEASLAMEKAQALLLKHNLSMAEVEPLGGDSPPIGTESVSVHTRASNTWLYRLAIGIAANNFCRSLVGRASLEDGNPRTARRLVFVGREVNVRVCCELLGWIVPQCEKWGRREKRLSGNNSGFRNEYMMGLTDGLVQRLEQYRREQEAQNVQVTAMVIRYQQENADYLVGKIGGKSRTHGMRGSEEARERGLEDAANVSIVSPQRQVGTG